MKEKAFVSLVLLADTHRGRLPEVLAQAHEALDAHFSTYEIIVVNDRGARVVSRLTELFRPITNQYHNKTVLLTLPWAHGEESAMFAGLEFSMGDYVFDVERLGKDFPKDLFVTLFHRAGDGYDIVNAASRDAEHRTALKIMHRIARKLTGVNLDLEIHSMRLVSRRALNALFQMRQKFKNRKAHYYFTGFRQATIAFSDPALNVMLQRSVWEELKRTFSVVLSLSNIWPQVSIFCSAFFFLATLWGGFEYFGGTSPSGDMSQVIFIFVSFGLALTLAMFSILLRYLMIILNEVYHWPPRPAPSIIVMHKESGN